MKEISVKVVGEYGDTVAVLVNGTNRGALLELSYEKQRLGGELSATFFLREGHDVPLYTGMLIVVYSEIIPVGVFEIEGNPEQRGTEGKVEIKCKGLAERLKNVILTDTLSSISLKDACLHFATEAAEVGIVVSEGNIALPDDVLISEVEIDGTTLFDFLSSLILYANGSSASDTLCWRINVDKELVIEDTGEEVLETFYEGYDFQSPTSEVSNSDQLNTLHFWRENETTGDQEYVDTFVDEDSADRYGVFGKRIELKYYATNADCARMAAGIFARHANPSRTITVSSVQNNLPFGLYRLAFQPVFVWNRLYAGEDKDALDLARSSGVSFENDATSMVGLYSTKCTLNATASGYVSIPIDPIIILPKRVRFFMKGTPGAKVLLTLVDKYGDTVSAELTFTGEWTQFVMFIRDTRREAYAVHMKNPYRLHPISEEEAPYVPFSAESDEAGNDDVFMSGPETAIAREEINRGFDYAIFMPEEGSGEDRALYMLTRYSVTSISEIRIQWETPSCEVWIDHVDCYVQQWSMESVPLNKAKYALVNDELIGEVEFGDEAKTAAEEITELWSVIRSDR